MAITKIPGVITVPSGDAGATAIHAATLNIQGFYWDNGTTGAADDACIVTDAAGNAVFSAHGAAKNDEKSMVLSEPIPVTGLKVTTLTHGTLYIYIAPPFPAS